MRVRPNFAAGLHGFLLTLALALTLPLAASAQPAMPTFSRPELNQMLAPVALYPDSLLSQVLMAASYPREVAEAARWSRDHPGMSGVPATSAVSGYPWDASVKSLVAFPQILAMMGDRPGWTERLGDAFLSQPGEVMDTVQELRQRANASGNLRSNDYYRVRQDGPYFNIFWGDPGYAYVPYYDPLAVYGTWAYADYPPIFWSPWPGYRVLPGYSVAYLWGPRIALGRDFFFGGFDWHHHRPTVWNIANRYHPRFAGAPERVHMAWQHDPAHRRGAPYRETAGAQRFARGPVAHADNRVERRAEQRVERRAVHREAAPRFEQHARAPEARHFTPQQHAARPAAPARVVDRPHGGGGGGGGHPHGGGGGGGNPHGGGRGHGHDK